MNTYKVKIFPKTKDFEKELVIFLLKNSSSLKRDFSIDNILNSESSPLNIDSLFKTNLPINITEIPGSTFQSHWRSNEVIYAISHTIKSISKEDEIFYGHIEPSPYGDIVDFEKGILRPIYYKKEKDDEYQLVTFDIDFNIT